MNIKTVCILSVFSWLAAFCLHGTPDELVIALETENRLIPVYIAPFAVDKPGLSAEEIKVLESVLHFDFDHNAVTQTTDAKESGAAYFLEVSLKEHKLSARVWENQGDMETVFSEVMLTGYPAEDRRILHRLSDRILEEVFGFPGVAATRVLYTVKLEREGKEVSDVWEADYDGANPRQITKGEGYCVTPCYLPPRRGHAPGSFFYVSYKTSQPKIYFASLEEGSGRRFSTLAGNQLMPAASRQRDKIAFISDAAGNPDLFLQDFSPEEGASGKPRHLFTAPLATQGTPAFSPEGSRIAFVSNKAGSPRIYVMEIPPAGTPLKEIKPLLISKHNRENTAPQWSPDGTKLAYCAKTSGVRQIWIYDFLSGLERQVTQGAGNKENPTWGPDSQHLLYNTSDAGACELYLIDLKRLKPVQITAGPGEKRFPNWEPRADP